MAFHDVRLPDDIEQGAVGGPRTRTTVTESQSGREQRQADWVEARHEFNISYSVRSKQDATGDGFAVLKEFWLARLGRLHTFRFRDWSDYQSGPTETDLVQIATGDGSTRVFQIVKTYADTAGTYTRVITRPVAATLEVRVANVVQTLGVDYNLLDKGLVQFLVDAPADGLAITASFEFDLEVRFGEDFLPIELSWEDAGAIPEIPVREVRGIDLTDILTATKVNAYAVLAPGIAATKVNAYAVVGP